MLNKFRTKTLAVALALAPVSVHPHFSSLRGQSDELRYSRCSRESFRQLINSLSTFFLFDCAVLYFLARKMYGEKVSSDIRREDNDPSALDYYYNVILSRFIAKGHKDHVVILNEISDKEEREKWTTVFTDYFTNAHINVGSFVML